MAVNGRNEEKARSANQGAGPLSRVHPGEGSGGRRAGGGQAAGDFVPSGSRPIDEFGQCLIGARGWQLLNEVLLRVDFES